MFKSIRTRVLTAIAAATCIAVLTPGTAGAQTPVASCDAPDSAGYSVNSSIQEVAQSFSVADDVTVDAINLHLTNPFDETGDFIVRVVPTDSGKPGTTVLAEGTVPLASTPPEDPGEPVVTVDFTTAAALDAGETYAFTISLSGSGTGAAHGSSGDPCPGGTAFYRVGSPNPWTADPDVDYWFELLGVPTDTDGDGTPDVDDACPDEPGPPSNNGCPLPPPDADGDGVPDSEDDCPNEAGPASNKGCPLPPVDTDGDGTPDSEDECPNEAGPASNKGCPLPDPDTTAPETTITSGPKKTTKSKVKFGFASSEAGSTFECKLKGKKVKKAALKKYAPCTSKKKYKRLKPGKYTFFVRATDQAGNVDPTPAKRKFKVVKKK
jgi:hypothetical protein